MTEFISRRTRNGNVKKIDELEKKMSELLLENSNLKDGKFQLENECKSLKEEVGRLTSELNEEREKSKQQQQQQQGYSLYFSHEKREIKYCMCTIITLGLCILHPLFES